MLYIHITLTNNEKALLLQIAQNSRCPIVRLELRNSQERSLISTALNHVYLQTPADTMEQVKQRSAVLQTLCDKGLIAFDYKVFITIKSDYTIYYESDIFALLTQLVEEGKQKPDYLFDIPYIKRGKIVLTDLGRQALQ